MDLLVVDNDAKFGATLDAALDGMAVTVLDDWTQFVQLVMGLRIIKCPLSFVVAKVMRNCVEWNPRLTVIFWATESPATSTTAAYAHGRTRYLARQRICQ